MSKRLRVVVALLVLVTLAVSASPITSSANGGGVYVRGRVWDKKCGEGIQDAVVNLYYDYGGSGERLVGTSTTVSGNGDFGIGITGQLGKYTLVVDSLPAQYPGSTAEVRWGNEFVGDAIGEALVGDTEEFAFFVTPDVVAAGDYGPVNFNYDNTEECVTPDPVAYPAQMYVFGRVVDNLGDPIEGAVVKVYRRIDDPPPAAWHWVLIGKKWTSDRGLFGFSIQNHDTLNGADAYRVVCPGAAQVDVSDFNEAEWIVNDDDMYINVDTSDPDEVIGDEQCIVDAAPAIGEVVFVK